MFISSQFTRFQTQQKPYFGADRGTIPKNLSNLAESSGITYTTQQEIDAPRGRGKTSEEEKDTRGRSRSRIRVKGERESSSTDSASFPIVGNKPLRKSAQAKKMTPLPVFTYLQTAATIKNPVPKHKDAAIRQYCIDLITLNPSLKQAIRDFKVEHLEELEKSETASRYRSEYYRPSFFHTEQYSQLKAALKVFHQATC